MDKWALALATDWQLIRKQELTLCMHVRSPHVYTVFSSRLLLTDHFGGCCFWCCYCCVWINISQVKWWYCRICLIYILSLHGTTVTPRPFLGAIVVQYHVLNNTHKIYYWADMGVLCWKERDIYSWMILTPIHYMRQYDAFCFQLNDQITLTKVHNILIEPST